jgi:glycosyltransferase involved in cell wall biosynthesis
MKSRLSIFIVHPSPFLTDHAPHGDGLLAHRYISELARRGHRLHIAVEDMSLTKVLPSNVTLYPVREDLGGVSPRSVPRLTYMSHVRRTLRRVLATESIDVAHQLNPVGVGLSLACAGFRLPLVLGPFVPNWPAAAGLAGIARISGWLHDSIRRPIGKMALFAQQLAADAFIVSTDAARARMALPSLFASRIVELPYGIDTSLFVPKQTQRGGAGPVILYLANLERRKGIFTLLDAFESVAVAMPECKLLIAGAGSAELAVRQRVAKLAAASRVTLLGRVDRENVPGVMQLADVYCLPSIGEPFGMTALEAMACGKPVVAAGAGGLAHLVRAEGGRQFSPGDSRRLATALIEILSSRDLQQRMGEHNRRLAETFYSWPRIVDKLENIYSTVLGSARAGTALPRA